MGGLALVYWGLEIGLIVQIPITLFDGFIYYCFRKLKLHREWFFGKSKISMPH